MWSGPEVKLSLYFCRALYNSATENRGHWVVEMVGIS